MIQFGQFLLNGRWRRCHFKMQWFKIKTMGKNYEILKWFEFAHLPKHIQVAVSEDFHTLAHSLANILPECEETQAMLRKLLEAKDCAVRAFLTEK